MVGKTKQRNKSENEIIDAMVRSGCVCCRQVGGFRSAEFHHITDRGRRVGHHYGLPLCEWHHRAVPMEGFTAPMMREFVGPSLAEGKAPFEQRFGTEAELYDDALRIAGLDHLRD